MRIMVFDVPAESGGALSVLHEFYNEYKLDTENKYFFVVSLPELQETSNVKVLRFPWVKRSWGHRLYFDYYVAPRLINKYKVKRVLSLQNIIIPHTKVYQSLFVHNALPFSEYRFTYNENKFLWIYQNIIGKYIMKSIKRADHVIVQTKWMKEKCIKKLNVNSEKIEIKPPKINIEVNRVFQKTKESLSTFFYPASGVVFKNHKVIVDACMNLKEEGIVDYKVIFTIKGEENEQIKQLFKTVNQNQLPIEFVGSLTREEVFRIYLKSILIFPSSIETVGLPLLEARMHSSPIIVYKQPFSEEVLSGYEYVDFISELEPFAFSRVMKKYIVGGDL